ncbi:unnamed protein product, partial [Brassica oleracea]
MYSQFRPGSTSRPDDLYLSRPWSTSRPDDLYLSRPGSTSRPDNFYLSPKRSSFRTEPGCIGQAHIVVWDSIPSSSVPDAWDAIMELFLQMVPYLLVECAATD